MNSPPSPQTARLPVWKRLLYSGVVVATLLILPEVTFRWTNADRALLPSLFKDHYDENDSNGMWRLLTSDPVLYWRGRPFARVSNTEEFLNDRGFRGNSFREEKPPRMQRVVCMGDSSTFGMVAHGGLNFTFSPTYSSELQSLLNKDKKVQQVEVINAGVIGYSTLQGLRLLKHEVRYWNPDLITIRYGTNDHLRIDPNYVAAPEPRSFMVRWVDDTLLDTRSYQLLIRLRGFASRAVAGTFSKAPGAAPPAQPAPVQVRVPLPDYEYNLRRLVIEARATGAQVVLITAPVAPASQEITSDRAKLWVMGYETYEQLMAQHQLYDDMVRRVAKDLDVELLDSSRLLQERGLEKYFTKVDFAHPTGLGHTVIAQDLAALIQSHGLLSK